MDISVSRLNKRMALQLPAEFPLGLVFVVGKVRELTNADGDGGPPYFYISESGYMLRCQLTGRALDGITLNEGDMVRAGGHLAFDSLQANYYLLARDIEVLPEHRPSRTTLAPILADIKKRSQAASLVPAELPEWVQQIAPPEFRTAEEPPEPADDSDETAETIIQTTEPEATAEPEADTVEAQLEQAPPLPEEEPLPEGFTDDLVEFLSEAMDSPEDVELTHEMVADLAPAIRPKQAQFKPAQPYDVTNTPTETRIPWAVVLLVGVLLTAFLGLILVLALLATR
jgi:hypothetical protein